MTKTRLKPVDILAPLVTFVLLFFLWEMIIKINEIPRWFIPPPTAIITSMINDFGIYAPHLLISFQTVATGFLIAIPIGICCAAIVTTFKLLSDMLTPYIILLVTTPIMTLVPLLMLAMGYGVEVRIVTVVIQAFAIINLNACTGFLNVPILRLELMQSLGASKLQAFFTVILPTAVVDVFTGIRLAAVFATIACISSEYVGGTTGLGSQIIKHSQFLKTTESFGCIFWVAVIGISMYAIITLVEKKIVSWKI